MPGIVGIIAQGPPESYQRLIGTMIGTMMHEPSYVSATRFAPDLGVYCGWVAHAASSAEQISSPRLSGRPWCVFAGECMEHRTHSALMAAYAEKGRDFVSGLDGLFSALLVDPAQRIALLFNDRFGGERLYFWQGPDALFFASEAKALLSVLPHARRFDDEGVAQFLAYGGTSPERTLFQGIRVMRPGSLWIFDGSSTPARSTYFDPNEWRAEPPLTEAEFADRLLGAFKRDLEACVETNASTGISITGGLDTRMIMAALPQAARKPICYTFAGTEGETLDVQIGRRVAAACGLEHHTLRIGPEFLANYGNFVDRTAYITDGCAGALGAHEIFFNGLARGIAPVRLTGNFGSEILRGMTTFKPLQLAENLLDPQLRTKVAALRSEPPTSETHPVIFAAFHEIPSIHYGIPAAARSQLTVRTPFMSNAIVELAVRSPPAARATPAACASIVERCSPALSAIPTDRGFVPQGARAPFLKRLYAEITFKLDYLHKEGLPPALAAFEPALSSLSRLGVLGLHKFLPYRRWFQRELAAYADSVLNDSRTREMGCWNAAALNKVLQEHQSGRENNLREIGAILTLEAVQRRLLAAPQSQERTQTQRGAINPCELSS